MESPRKQSKEQKEQKMEKIRKLETDDLLEEELQKVIENQRAEILKE